ncbi:MAG: hypothetical protein AABX72_00280 [Nanoarchaeota archaeon]
MNATLERKPKVPNFLPFLEHDESRFLYYLGSTQVYQPYDTRVLASTETPLGTHLASIYHLYLAASPLVSRYPFHGNMQWRNKYGVLSLNKRIALTPYQFDKPPQGICLSKKGLDNIVTSWEEDTSLFEQFFQKHFAALNGVPLKKEFLLEEDLTLPILDMGIVLRSMFDNLL